MGCGFPVRPDVVWFGETLPDDALQAALEAARNADLLLVIGTSLQVQPAAGIVPLALDAGAQVIDINPEPALLPDERVHALAGSAAKVVPRLVEAAFG